MQRDNPELLIVALTFLKKLSIFKENNKELAKCDGVAKIAKFVPCQNEVTLSTKTF
jgi:hypothetical protein